jgi:putative oxidoreductase
MKAEVTAMRSLLFSKLTPLYRLFSRLSSKLQSSFLLAVRLYWGWQFAQSGWGKLHRLDGVTEFFASLNIPFPHANAIMVSNLEFFGGILLILGLASRLTGLVLTGNMLVAYLTSDRVALGSIFSDPGKFYNADPYTFLFASILMLIFGAGLFSADAILARVFNKPVAKVRSRWPTTEPSAEASRTAALAG